MASVENGSEFLADLFKKLRSSARKMPGFFKERPGRDFLRHVWINPFWEDDVNETVESHGRRPGHLRVGLAPHRSMPAPLDYTVELKAFDADERRLILNDNVTGLITSDRPEPPPTWDSAAPTSSASGVPLAVMGDVVDHPERAVDSGPSGSSDEPAGHDDHQPYGHERPDQHVRSMPEICTKASAVSLGVDGFRRA